MSRKRKDEHEEAVEAVAGPPRVSVGAHPRARTSIRRTRAIAGLAGFAVVLALSLGAGVPGFDATVRALIGGIVAHFGAWFAALALWRRLVVAELELARQKLLAEREADAEARAQAA